jgi:ubiquinone/menaquinone biosynthesis C-methylase UbiE
MRIEERLGEIVLDDVHLREVEPHIYSFNPDNEAAYYDEFGGIYEVVACNRYYNKLIWGYSISEYRHLCVDALESSKDEWVLDAGCGSLAFTAKTYILHAARPTVLLDQSIRMLRLARSRLMKLNGAVPGNMVFIQGDMTHLPFRDGSIRTVVALNVLHAVQDAGVMMLELRRVMAEKGSMTLTTLVKNHRLADRYIDKLGKMGALVPRSLAQLLDICKEIAMPVQYLTRGNLAFVQHGRSLEYFETGASGHAGSNHE